MFKIWEETEIVIKVEKLSTSEKERKQAKFMLEFIA